MEAFSATDSRAGLCRLRNEEVLELGGAAVIPAFLDIHTHGAVGVDVNAASAEDFEKTGLFFARQGTGSFLCSILTDTEEQTERAIQAFLDWKKLPHAGADLLGIHLEGPFLSPKHKGAMPESLLRTPDYDLIARYQEKAEGHIRYITLAPELPGAIELSSEAPRPRHCHRSRALGCGLPHHGTGHLCGRARGDAHGKRDARL